MIRDRFSYSKVAGKPKGATFSSERRIDQEGFDPIKKAVLVEFYESGCTGYYYDIFNSLRDALHSHHGAIISVRWIHLGTCISNMDDEIKREVKNEADSNSRYWLRQEAITLKKRMAKAGLKITGDLLEGDK